MDARRIRVKHLHRQMTRGSPILLVCGYDGEDRFREMELEGAISWNAFQSRLPSLSLDQEIVLYCA